MRIAITLTLAGLWLAAAGCGGENPPGVPADNGPDSIGIVRAGRELTVYCAAGVRPPVAELAEEFGRRENLRVATVYSGSGVLLSQIDLAQRGDVYVAGDQFFMQQAVNKGLVAKPVPVAHWVAVIGVQKGNPKGVKGVADLARADLKVGLCDEKAAAVGRSAASMLAKAGLAGKVKPAVITMTVNELGNHLKFGTLDAAIIWDAIAKQYDVDAVPIEPQWRESVSIPAGVLKFTKDERFARKFVEFLAGEDGRRAFAKHGYTVSIEEQAK
jgi:molybdate transport system substrate-binding protein